MGIIINKLCLIVIAIVGEETYKIYSKKVFEKEVSLETNIDELYEELDKEITDAKESLEKENASNDSDSFDEEFSLKKYPIVISSDNDNIVHEYDENMSMLKRD